MAIFFKKLQEGGTTSTGVLLDKNNLDIRDKYKQTSNTFQDRVKAINYNQEFPMKTAEGDEFFLTRTTEAMMNDSNFREFAPGISAYTDRAMIPSVGNYRGVSVDPQTGKSHYLSSVEGDTSMIERAIFGKISNADLGF